MASVGTKHTGPELLLRKALHRLGLRFRLHRADLAGKPDIVLTQYRTVIFVHGCFWHAHGCRLSTIPSTRKEFWRHKFITNTGRDHRNVQNLRTSGWRIIIVWQCGLGSSREMHLFVAAKIQRWLLGRGKYMEIPSPPSKSPSALNA